MRARKTRRRGCGTTDQHRQWLNSDISGLVTGSITWAIALSGAFGVYVRDDTNDRPDSAIVRLCFMRWSCDQVANCA